MDVVLWWAKKEWVGRGRGVTVGEEGVGGWEAGWFNVVNYGTKYELDEVE